jgi:hypothetical protein
MMARGAPKHLPDADSKKTATGSLRLQMGCSHTLAAAQRENFQFNDGRAVR